MQEYNNHIRISNITIIEIYNINYNYYEFIPSFPFLILRCVDLCLEEYFLVDFLRMLIGGKSPTYILFPLTYLSELIASIVVDYFKN